MKPFGSEGMMTMHKFRREAEHKLRALKHSEAIGDVGRAYRYFGVGRASLYRWQDAYRQYGVSSLENLKTFPALSTNPSNAERDSPLSRGKRA
jgi:Helix-turn-helix domain